MIKPKIPAAEAQRLATLKGCQVLDTAIEQVFDNITALAANTCGTSFSLISLIDADRQWFKSAYGLEGVCETPRDISFCAHAILGPALMEVPDTLQDERFSDNPFVLDGPRLRFYAGMPLIMPDGQAIGTLCVLDRQPRYLSDWQRRALQLLAEQTATLLEARRQALREQTRDARFRLILDNALDAFILVDSRHRILEWNRQAERIFGWPAEEAIGQILSVLIMPAGGREMYEAAMPPAPRSGLPGCPNHVAEMTACRRDGATFPVELAVTSLEIEGGCVYSLSLRDLSATRRLETIRLDEKRILEQMAAGLPLDDILPELARMVEKHLPGGHCAIFQSQGGRLWPRVMDGLPFLYAEVLRTNGVAIAEGAGCCGTAAYRRVPVIIDDIANDPLCSDRSALALAGGLRACWAHPVLSARQASLGALGIYYKHCCKPDADEVDFIRRASHLASILMERDRIDLELQQARRQMEIALTAAHLGTWEWDPQTNEIRHSRNLPALLGLPPDRRLHTLKDFLRLVQREDTGKIQHAVREALASGQLQRVEFRISQAGLGQRWLSARGVAFAPQAGGATRLTGILVDVTERKQTEQALLESEEAYRTVVESLQEVVFRMDAEGRWVFLNAAWSQITGYGVHESIGKVFLDFVHPDDRQVSSTIFQSLVDGRQERYTHDVRYLNKDGSSRWIAVAARLLVDMHGQAMGCIGTLNDITQRKVAEDTMRLHERALASSSNGIVIVDMRLPDQPIIYTNTSFEKMTGYAAAESLGRNCRFLQAAERDQPQLAEIRQALHERRECRVTVRNYRKDGAPFWNELTLSPVKDAQGEVTHFIGIQSDITARKEVEEQLVQARHAAEAANRAKSEFLANISHEIRTPMNGIIGMTELTLQTLLDAEQRDNLELVRRSADSLLTLINDLLDFSKIEAGRLELEKVPFRLDELVEEITRSLRLRVNAGVCMKVHLEPGLDTPILGDRVRLGQVLINLLGNALKFTETGEVVLAVRAASQEEQQLTLHFSVRDTGIGISQDKVPHIFEAFTQADASTSRHYGGTGLGLAICARLVALMGGQIWVDSVAGKGSTFHFLARLGHLPVTDEQQAPVPHLTGKPSLPGRPLHILVAEDNETNQRLIVRLLENMGHRARIVGNGTEAVAAAGAAQFDLILMDVQMPQMNGIEATEAIREWEKTTKRHTPIIALTAHAMDTYRQRCLAAGMDDFLTKPIRLEALTLALGRWAAVSVQRAAAAVEAAAMDAPVDLQYLGDVFGHDRAAMREILHLFADSIQALHAAIHQASLAKDVQAIGRHAHQLKGSSANIGARALAQQAQVVERLARPGKGPAMPGMLMALEERVQQVVRFIEQWEATADGELQ